MSGRRNEPARERHRYQLKKNFSLTSVTQDELDSPGSPIGRKLSLSNHFGWVVVSKSKLGDVAFPHLSEFYEKPDPEGRDFQKITYVLFMDKGAVIDKGMEIKETQTSVTGAEGEPQQVFREYPKSGESVVEEETESKRAPKDRRQYGEKKRRSRGRYLISEFYYVPKENRSLSRSTRATSGEESETDNENIQKEKRRPRSRSSHKSSGKSNSDDGKKRKKKSRSRSKASSGKGSKGRKKKSKKRAGPDKWQLRAPAGADNVEGSTDCEYTETESTLKTTLPLKTSANTAGNQYSQVRQARKQKSRI